MVFRVWRPRVVAGLAFVTAIVLFVAGLVVWRQMSTLAGPPVMSGALYFRLPEPYRLHPLRAEILWAASAAFAVIGVWVSMPTARRPRLSETATV